ncbi:hypothetical protein ACIBG4_12450 [Nonomuraea sp. NPDC050383]|uniref:hypothetical protein n=1 Tax=Nonomuraea sp. NPDC050383 TaxID=3364362 RepID=UPI0037A7E046
MMPKIRSTGRAVALVTASMLAGGMLTAGGAALATAMNEAPINACVTTSTGALRIVPPGTVCEEGETALDWNRQGSPGQLGVFTIKGPGTRIAPGETAHLRADCGDGNYAISGGYLGERPTAPISVFANTIDNNDTSAWRVSIMNHSETTTYPFVTYASCVPLPATR